MARGDIRVRLLGDISDLSSSLSEAGGRIGDFASGLASRAGLAFAGAGAAGGALFVKGFSDGLDFDAANDQLAAQLGLTTEAAELAGDAAASLYNNAWGESMGEVSAAIGAVAQNDLVDLENATQDSVESITAGVLDISNAFTEDFGTATRAAGQLLRTGLAADATEALDIITVGFQGGANRAEDFLDTLNEYAPAFSRLGLDGAQAVGLISQGLDAGAFNADKIGDAFNEFSIRVIDGSANSRQAIEDLGFSYDEMAATIAEGGPAAAAATDDIIRALANVGDQVDQDAAGVALFGSIWEDLGADVITALNPAEAAVGDFAGATAEMGDVLNDNLGTKIETLKRTALTGLTTFMSDNVIPGVEAVMEAFSEDGLAGVFELVSQAIEDALPEVIDNLEEMGKAIIDWIAEQGPKIAEQIVDWIAAMTEWVSENRREILRRLGLLISDVLQWILDHVDDIALKLAEWAAAFIEWVIPIAGQMLADLGWMLGQMLNWIVTDAAPQIAEKLLIWAVEFGAWIAKAALSLLLNLPDLVAAAATAGGRAGEELINSFVSWINRLPQKVYDGAREAGRRMADGIMDGLGNITQRILDQIPGLGSNAFGPLIEQERGKAGSGGGSKGIGGRGVTAAGFFGAAGVVPDFGGIDASFAPDTPTVVINQSFGVGTSPVEAGRAVEEVLFRFAQNGGNIRVTSTDPLVATVG